MKIDKLSRNMEENTLKKKKKKERDFFLKKTLFAWHKWKAKNNKLGIGIANFAFDDGGHLL